MQYSKEELLTIGKFYEIPNVDESKTQRQLTLIIHTWFTKRIKKINKIFGDFNFNVTNLYNDLQLYKENMHLPLPLRLEKMMVDFIEKRKEQVVANSFASLMYTNPIFVETMCWVVKQIFGHQGFDAKTFEQELAFRCRRLII